MHICICNNTHTEYQFGIAHTRVHMYLFITDINIYKLHKYINL